VTIADQWAGLTWRQKEWRGNMLFRIKRSQHLIYIQTMHPRHYSKRLKPLVLHIFSFGINWLISYQVLRGGGASCVVSLLTFYKFFLILNYCRRIAHFASTANLIPDTSTYNLYTYC
jgi:hypothetical protein